MLVTILLNLLGSFLLLYFFGSIFGRKGSTLFASFNLFICFILSCLNLSSNIFNNSSMLVSIVDLGNWMSILYVDISWKFLVDSLSSLMIFVVISISTCVHFYSVYYMEQDVNIVKFFSYLTIFTFFMCILVLSSNFLILFLGWEGVGLCSFLLISFWSSRVQANKAALKAMLINRVGDFFLLISICLLVLTFKSVDYFTIFTLVPVYQFKFFFSNFHLIDFISLLILLGAITKSAQLGLHGWLPDAMEGPTPVSALIHAATMVTAGVFLIIRTSYIFSYSSLSLTCLVYIGSLTALIFGLVGLFQYDIKKIIAFSTCSQLGYMMLACGLSGYNSAFFHLFTHASFKALLFLSAGTFIHLMSNEQDLRKMNGAFNLSYLNGICFIIGSLVLVGFPFLSGFFSKDSIIQLAFLYNHNPAIFMIIEMSTGLTILYTLKSFYYLFIKKNFNARKFIISSQFNYFNFVPLICLSIFSIVLGYLFKVIFLGAGNNIFFGSIFTLSVDTLEVEFVSFWIKIIPLYSLIFLSFLFYIFYVELFKENTFLYFYSYNVFLFFNKRLFLDSLINLFIAFPIFRASYKIFQLFDKGFLEICGPYSLINAISQLNSKTYNLLLPKYQKVLLVSFLFFIALVVSWCFIFYLLI